MEEIVTKHVNDKSLPPNVEGYCRGELIMTIHGINLKWDNRVDYSKDVQLTIVWWGESLKTGVSVLFNTDNKVGTNINITYKILTSIELFQEYLKTCEPVMIRLLLLAPKCEIGKSYISIPRKMLDDLLVYNGNKCLLDDGLTCSTRSKGQVLNYNKISYPIDNTKNRTIGEIIISFSLTIFDSSHVVTKKFVSNTVCNKGRAKENEQLSKLDLRSNRNKSKFKKSIIRNDDKLKQNLNLIKSSHSVNNEVLRRHTSEDIFPSKLCVLNYLTGCPMSAEEERRAIDDIRCVSPSNSLIYTLHEDILKSTDADSDVKGRQIKINEIKENEMNSVEVHVDKLLINRRGIQLLNAKNKPALLFIVECKLDSSKLISTESENEFYTECAVVRFSSGIIKDLNLSVTFKTTLNPMIHIKNRNMIDFINLQLFVWYRQLNNPKQSLNLFGTYMFPVKSLLTSENFSISKKCSLRSINEETVGAIWIKVNLCYQPLCTIEELFRYGLCLTDKIENSNYNKTSVNFSKNIARVEPKLSFEQSKELTNTESNFNGKSIFSVTEIKPVNNKNGTNEQTAMIETDKNVQKYSIGNVADATKLEDTRSNKKDYLGVDTMDNKDNSGNVNPALYGLFYLGSLYFMDSQDNVKDQLGSFVMYDAFWKESTTKTVVCHSNFFNYLEMFPVLIDEKFHDMTKHQNLKIELWQKNADLSELLVGISWIPLHYFHIAYSTNSYVRAISKSKDPVVAVDDWILCLSATNELPFAQIQVILAIGTKKQIDDLKTTRCLTKNSGLRSYLTQTNELIFSPSSNAQFNSISLETNANNAETQTNFMMFRTDAENQTTITSADKKEQITNTSQNNNNNNLPDISSNSFIKSKKQGELSDMLNHFIDTLALRLPLDRNVSRLDLTQPVIPSASIIVPTAAQTTMTTTTGSITTKEVTSTEPVSIAKPIVTSSVSNINNIQHSNPIQKSSIRRTSDLLDTLQRALMTPPTSSPLFSGNDLLPLCKTVPSHTVPNTEKPLFNVIIDIENALHISKISLKMNKKCGKRKCKVSRPINEVEPSTYVTFEANGPATSTVSSNEGPVYTTNVVEKNCNPIWNKRFAVLLPVDIMTNSEKRFILKIWRKTSIDIPQARLLPNPFEDIIIGFTSIDLSVLLAGMPTISGWYNIIDFTGRINGQIKITIQPAEDVKIYRQQSLENRNLASTPISAESLVSSDVITLLTSPSLLISSQENYCLPLNIDVSPDLNNGTLNRTLKRKFNELEEITERLKARLFDITGNVDDIYDPDEEFEKDLNTKPDDEDEHNDGFDVKNLINGVKRKSDATIENNNDLIYLHNTSLQMNDNQLCVNNSNKFSFDDNILNATLLDQSIVSTDCTDIIDLDRIMNNFDVDTIVNPNILRTLIDPMDVSTSEESTSRSLLDKKQECSSTVADISSTSTPSSNVQERIRFISNALQRTVISELPQSSISGITTFGVSPSYCNPTISTNVDVSKNSEASIVCNITDSIKNVEQ